jgi:CBS domain-containing protein
VKNTDHSDLIGMLSRKEIISYYNDSVEQIREKLGYREQPQMNKTQIRLTDKVSDVIDKGYPYLSHDLPSEEALNYLVSNGIDAAPVVGSKGELLGMVSLSDCERFSRCLGLVHVSISDVCVSEITPLTPSMSIIEAFHLFCSHEYSVLPVVNAKHVRHYMGAVHRNLVMKMVEQYTQGRL